MTSTVNEKFGGKPDERPSDIVLHVEGVTKRFPGVLANENVSLSLRRGEILALLGENGAGKSTLMNIIYGLYHPDAGHIRLRGKEVRFASPREAILSGIGMVHQHFQLIPVMTVAENVILGEEQTAAWRMGAGRLARLPRLLAGDRRLTQGIRWVWGALWRSLTPAAAAGIGLLIGQIAMLLVLVLSTYLAQGEQFQTSRFNRLPLEERATLALASFFPDHREATAMLLWSPLALGSMVGAAAMVLLYRHARRTWRGSKPHRDDDGRIAPLDSALDSLIDLSSTTSAVQDKRKAAERVRDLSRRFNLEVEPEALIEKLPVGIQQRVEIVKALYRKADILILDEPTAVLTPQESRELFRIMKQLAAQGVSIIFITHKLKEVFAVADRIVVMRGGRVVGEARPGEATEESLAAMMVGREVLLRVTKEAAQPGPVVLAVEGLTVMGERGALVVENVGFEVRAGEILGIAGVQGNGQTELVEALSGLRKPLSGKIAIAGEVVRLNDPRAVTDMGTAHIPEDRQRYGMVKPFSVADNLVLNSYYRAPFATFPSLRQLPIALLIYGALLGAALTALAALWASIYPQIVAVLGLEGLNPRRDPGPFMAALAISLTAALFGLFIAHVGASTILRLLWRALAKRGANSGGLTIDKEAVSQNAQQLIREFDIRTPSHEVRAGNLSGGNQQKMVVAREFSRKPRLLIASQPTRGIDVGSIEFIHQRIVQQRDAGAAVLLVSAELDEIMALSDRIAVMYKGQIIDILPADSVTREQLGLLMAGIRRQSEATARVAQELPQIH